MIRELEFEITAPLICAAIVVLMQPAVLAGLARISQVKNSNAAKFALSSVVTFLLWLIFVLATAETINVSEFLVGAMALITAEIFYLEVWALITGGYTLTLLLTLLNSEQPLNAAEIANRYHGGDNLSWILQHRLGKLIDTRLVRRDRELVILTNKGTIIARLYEIAIAILGLRTSG